MKHLIGLTFIICQLSFSIVLTSCAGEEDDIFEESAAERLNESSAKYSARLEAQPNGWAMQYYPTYNDEAPYGSGYLILMRFNPDFSVKVAMDNSFSGNVYLEDTSAWEVIKDNGPVLSFNSFNRCMHAFSDPEDIPWTSDNEQSEGCAGDYEFIIVEAPEDASYMMLKGKKRDTYNLLTPIEEGVDYQDYLADVKAFHNKMFSATAPVGNFINFGSDSIYHMDDANDGIPNIYPLGTDPISNESFNPFLISKLGQDYYLRFRDEFKRDDMEGTLQELRYDSIQDRFIGTQNPEFTITGYPVSKFFAEYVLMANKNYWFMARTEVMSEKLMACIEAVSADFALKKDKKNRAYVFNGIRFSHDSKTDVFQWEVAYKPGASSATTAPYAFLFEQNGDHLKFTYDKPNSTGAENIYNQTESVVSLINLLSQEFVIAPAETSFDVTRIKLTSVSDPDIWFYMSI